MIFDNAIIDIPFITGIIFIILGFILSKLPPKKINSFYGYRTVNSMKNKESWDFAQKYSGKELVKFGLLLMISSLIGVLFKPSQGISVAIGLGLMVTMVVFVFIRVEKALKSKSIKLFQF